MFHGANVFQVYDHTIMDVKLYILEKEGIPPSKQTLSYRGNVLDNLGTYIATIFFCGPFRA